MILGLLGLNKQVFRGFAVVIADIDWNFLPFNDFLAQWIIDGLMNPVIFWLCFFLPESIRRLL